MKQESAPPSLRLVILQGPRKGQTLDFKPGQPIKIGRVVRGNTLPIKDPGISTKHLSILTESTNWILRDLDSSNGTVLDAINIPPNTPFHLRDGSTIKIGETTIILVSFLQPQQNPNRTTRTGSVTFVEPVHETEEEVDVPVAKPVRGRRGKGLKSIDENASVNDGDESGFVDRPVSRRVTRNSKNTRAVSDTPAGNLDVPVEKVEGAKNIRVTRNLKNKQNVVEVCDSSIGNSDAIEEKMEKVKNTRVTRNTKSKEQVVEIAESIGVSDALKEKVEEERKKNTRVTRNSKNKVSVVEENLNLEHGVENVEKKKTRGGAKGKNKLQEECVGVGVGVGKGDGGKENCDDETERGNLNGDMNFPDLEKMSLGEWFDFMEVQLPKQVIDSTEEMFDSMRQKAERLREYITMQENSKLKVPPE